MRRKFLFGWLRLAFGALGAVALGFQAYRSAAVNGGLGNFFSYFTVLSNCAAVVVLLAMGAATLSGTRGVPDLVRGAVTLYMAITGVIYQVLLSGLSLDQTIPWVNHVLHQVLPIVMFVYWLADPPRQRVELRRAVLWLAFPLAFLAYSLIRGPLVGDWYPYPFLDPNEAGGYGGVAARCLGITAAFVVVMVLLTWLGNGRRRDLDRKVLTAGGSLPRI